MSPWYAAWATAATAERAVMNLMMGDAMSAGYDAEQSQCLLQLILYLIFICFYLRCTASRQLHQHVQQSLHHHPLDMAIDSACR
jgi:uncharacterized membrane protein